MADLPPFALVTGPEALLAERAVASLVADLRERDPELEVITVAGTGYEPGLLAIHASPSLFATGTAIVVEDADEGNDELIDDIGALVAEPAPDVTLIVRHKGGQRGKKVLDALKAAKARVIDCPAIKTDNDKRDFVLHEFRRGHRQITPQAAVDLVEAVGKDLRELAASCAQLMADTQGRVDEAMVETYHGGKVEATGFKVADAAVAGDISEALRLLRHALATGVDPVPIVAVIASQLRTLVRVGSAGNGSSASVARDLSLAPWQVDKARRSVKGWSGDALGAAIQATAAADVEVKGGGRDPEYAVERLLLTIAQLRRARG